MEILHNPSLKSFNTFGIDVKAPYLVRVNSLVDLQKAYDLPELRDLNKMALGGGSNLLFTQDFAGAIIKMDFPGIEVLDETESHVIVKAGAGVVWHQFVLYCIEKGWAGIENMSLIPGNVGAAPMQNIGAYGVEINSVFESLEAWLPELGSTKTFSKKECQFGYRMSIFKTELKNKAYITSVTFKLSKSPKINTTYGAIENELNVMGIKNPGIKDVSNAVIRIRQSKLPDPKEIGNAGSFFKNPVISKSQFEAIHTKFPEMPSYRISKNEVKVPAGWLIEQAGFKGKTYDNKYGVHKNQALVLVNYGGGTGQEIYDLSTKIIDAVLTTYNIELEREVNIL
ncbi:MAG: UDP-N-acetylmuramate dehydrogenase [Flavobacteriales bacterium]|nr:UDP-N-acetylmuramate dehydrogenase [Flavobacteriales bacterium]